MCGGAYHNIEGMRGVEKGIKYLSPEGLHHKLTLLSVHQNNWGSDWAVSGEFVILLGFF